jgi:hypothetical protein
MFPFVLSTFSNLQVSLRIESRARILASNREPKIGPLAVETCAEVSTEGSGIDGDFGSPALGDAPTPLPALAQ